MECRAKNKRKEELAPEKEREIKANSDGNQGTSPGGGDMVSPSRAGPDKEWPTVRVRPRVTQK